ncbi:hypothetical protein B0A48_18438 [Cryoendolithus antarcticus]|uniref:BTB domain-containing protein n=1 Tax=Cryoendolithus antarcticus TaxID=1507870 RepID=A0A1V8S8P5_9PEZI|nr:hypothetical protein B0A48_18438 [Cryoendolithus antarcticus]
MAASTTVISTNGDVILLLLDKSKPKVSSHFLSQVSTTFRALLGSRFAEGQQHRSAEFPQYIHLPDDDPTAMLHLCSILQYMPLDEAMRSKHDAPTVKRILQFAATADKYDCAAAVELTITSLLARFMQPGGTLSLCLPHLSDLALAAHLLRLPRHFTIFTSCIVTEHTDPFSILLSEGIAEHPGAGAIFALEEQRTAARVQCAADVGGLALNACDLCYMTGLFNSFTNAHAKILNAEEDHNPSSTVNSSSLGVLKRKILRCDDIVVTVVHPDRRDCDTYYTIEKETIWQIAHGMSDIAHGLCLSCARDPKESCSHKSVVVGYVKENEGP